MRQSPIVCANAGRDPLATLDPEIELQVEFALAGLARLRRPRDFPAGDNFQQLRRADLLWRPGPRADPNGAVLQNRQLVAGNAAVHRQQQHRPVGHERVTFLHRVEPRVRREPGARVCIHPNLADRVSPREVRSGRGGELVTEIQEIVVVPDTSRYHQYDFMYATCPRGG